MLEIVAKNKNSHNSLIKFIFSIFLKCVCVEMKSIWKSTIFILFFFRTPKSFLQENEKLGGGGGKNFCFLNNLKNS
jgi:hypothetical protein